MSTEREDWILLALTPGIGPMGMLKLLQSFGSASAALHAPASRLEGIIDTRAAQALRSRAAEPDAQAALEWEQRPDTFLLTLLDDDYPPPLAESPAPPTLLFGLGRRALLARPMLAIVGSRNALEPACATAREFSGSLAEAGYTIVSGLASGIDSAAHQGALRHEASTVAVIGTGIDRVYPASNHALARHIAQDGLILSEFALGAKPLAMHFPRRNRIIAGLSRACLVVEASVESGSLITARLALEAGREVMAIPGSIHNPRARGCHRLIKQGATLIETVDDVLDEVGRLNDRTRPSPPPPSEPDHPIARALGHEARTIDELSIQLGLTAADLYAMLLQLELEGRVASLPGGRFQWLGFSGSEPSSTQ